MIKRNDDVAKHDGTGVTARIVAMAIALVLSLGCLTCAPTHALADDAGAQTGDGVIDVSYINDDEPIADARLSVYRVAQWRTSGGYEPTEAFSRYADAIDWEGLLNADNDTFRMAAQTLSTYAQRDGIEADARAVTDRSGAATFRGLAKGLYLVSVDRYDGVSGTDTHIVCDASALLVALPTVGDGNRTMHAVLSPKTECETKPQPETVALTARKVWRNDVSSSGVSADRPASITVQLLRDGVVVDTVRLNAANRWRHRWTGLESGHDWRVAETRVPARYMVTLDREGTEIVITNTHATSPQTGADVLRLVSLAAVIAVAAIGLFVCVAIGRGLRRD